MMNTNTTTTAELSFDDTRLLIHRALRALSGVCDGAQSEDKVGFNGRDTNWGKEMAASDPSRWSPRCTFLLANMLIKYGKQLERHGIDITPLRGLHSKEDAEELKKNSAPPEKAPEPVANPRKVTMLKSDKPNKPPVFKVEFPYNPDLVSTIKALPYVVRKWDGTNKCWMVSFDESNFEQAAACTVFHRMMLAGQFEMSNEAIEYLFSVASKGITLQDEMRVNKVISFATQAADLEIEGLNGVLMDFQKAGVIYGQRTKRTFIADEMGLGKTPQSLAVVHSLKAYPCLIVCRSVLMENWRREILKWLPGATIGKPYDRDCQFVLASHHEVVKFQDWLADEWKCNAIIVDEIHDFKGYKAQRTQALTRIADAHNAEVRLGLTGTPMPNRPKEFIPQLTILGRLKDFGGWRAFVERYCAGFKGIRGWEIDGATNKEELNEKLRSICYIRRMKADVLKDLPAKQRDIVYCQVNNMAVIKKAEEKVKQRMNDLRSEQAALRETIKEQFFHADIEGMADMIRQFCPNTSEITILEMVAAGLTKPFWELLEEQMRFNKMATEGAQKMMILRELMREVALQKLPQFIEWVKGCNESGKKMAIFAYSRDVQEILTKELPNAIWSRDRKQFKTSQAAVDRFGEDESVMNLVLSLSGDNAGINGIQQVCSTVAFFEFDWVFVTHEQAEDRAHRIGQHDLVQAYYFMASGTIEEKVWELLMAKKALAEEVVDGKKSEDQTFVKRNTSIAGDLAKSLMAA